MVAHRVDPTRSSSYVSCRGNKCSLEFLVEEVMPPHSPIRDLHDLFSMIPDPSHSATRCLQFDCDTMTTARCPPPSNVLNCAKWDPLEPNDDFLRRIIGSFEALARNFSDVEYCVRYLGKEVRLASLSQKLVAMCVNPNMLKFHLNFFCFLTIMIPIVPPQAPEAAPLVLEATPKLLKETPSSLARGSNVKMFDLDKDKKAKTNMVAHGVMVSVARDTLHGQLIEEGNASV